MLSAGFAQADITPLKPTQLSGFASRTGLATETLLPLTARVLALAEGDTRLALVALDLIGVPDRLEAAVQSLLGPNAPQLTITAIHTHAGPPVLDRAMLGAPPAGYIDGLAQHIAGAVGAAFAALQPAVLGHRTATTVGIAHNRRDPAGPVDPSIDIVTVDTPAGEPIAIWLTFACHPVVLGPDNLAYAPDFPGYARAAIEAETGVPVLYATGCAGEINLGHSALDSIRKIGMERRTPREAMRIGGLVAEAVLGALKTPGLTGPNAALRTARSHVPARFDRPTEKQRAAIANAAADVLANLDALAGERIMAEIDQAWLRGDRTAWGDLPVSAIVAGPVRAAFLPGEIFVETALALKRRHPGTIVIGYAHANPGYIPPQNARGGYEVDVAWRPYGAPGPFAPGMAENLADAAGDLIDTLKR